jgi:uncharacterized protein YndB with AHSA1/START domain
MSDPDLVYVTYIVATPEALWRSLTDSDFIEKYWAGRRAETDWRTGSPVTYRRPDGGIDFVGEIRESDPPLRLAYTFHVQGPADGDEGPSLVTFAIEPLTAEVVRLTVTHGGFPADSGVRAGVSHGWPGLLSGLKTLVETGRPMPAIPMGAKA